ncbi:hypothetical protein M885DRAFT_500093 [Pelagophyceae sp. CCMP2097]|nr:hypothetical protein M885DRAFT_500093 [Pelagophyceae sp. CCMP2097]
MAAGDTDKVAAKAEKATKAATQKAEKVAKRGAAKLEKAVKAQDRKRAERAIDDDDEPDEDELHEEAQDSAVRFLQKAFRSKRARRLVKELIISNYVKEYDADKECFVYKNKRTGARQSNKPIALGADDLPDPVATFAPQGYETHPSGVRQCVFMKWRGIDVVVISEDFI